MDIFDKFAEMVVNFVRRYVVKFVVNKLLDWIWKKTMADVKRQAAENTKEMVKHKGEVQKKSLCTTTDSVLCE